jgi:replicative DNA helicase
MIDHAYLDAGTEVEQALLGSILRIGDTKSELYQKATALVKDTSFYRMSHRLIFKAITDIAIRNNYVDLLTVTDLLEKEGRIDDVGGFAYVAQLMNSIPSTANIVAYAKTVRDYAVERFAIQKMNEAMGLLADRTAGDINQRLGLVESMANQISSLSQHREEQGLKHISEGLGTWLDNIQQLKDDGFDKNALSTGIDSLDEIIGPRLIRRGALIGVGARPKMGKTALMMYLSNHIGLNLNLPVANFSMEMASHEIVERSLTTRELLAPNEFYKPDFSDEVQGKLDRSFREFVDSNIFVDDGSNLTLSHIQRESRKLRNEKGELGAIMVDYLTLMKAEDAERNDLAYGLITKGLKSLAKELNCPVILLTQLNRGLENRADKRPLPSDSRDTGQIEQDVDLWIGIYKESVYDENTYMPGLMELLVRLNRHGGTGTAFVEMKQGFIVPVSLEEGRRIINERETRKGSNSGGFKYES